MSVELTLPSTVERRNKLDISLGYCSEIDPGRLISLGPALEIRVDEPAQLVDFLLNDSEEDRLHFVKHLQSGGKEWEYACFARHGRWTLFSSVFSTALAYNPLFADGRRRRLCCGGTRVIARRSLEAAAHRPLDSAQSELVAALEMDLFLAQAMTGKNLSNGFNIGGSKTLVYVGERTSQHAVEPRDVRELARFMARCHNSMTQSLPVFVGTGSDINFHEHGDAYYDLCSRLSPNYAGNALSAARWGRVSPGNTTGPTASGVLACLDAVTGFLGIPASERTILVKGLGGIGSAVVRHHLERGWKVYATEIRREKAAELAGQLGDSIQLVDEADWSGLPQVSLFSPNAAGSSVTAGNLPVLAKLGVKAIVGGENNILDKQVEPDAAYRQFGILTFADFLVNGGGAWIVDAELVERPPENVHEWIAKYQVPTLVQTIVLGRELDRSPESVFVDFIASKVEELLA